MSAMYVTSRLIANRKAPQMKLIKTKSLIYRCCGPIDKEGEPWDHHRSWMVMMMMMILIFNS
jgi:hypothetical protein